LGHDQLKNKVLEKLQYDASKKFEIDRDATKQYIREQAELAGKKKQAAAAAKNEEKIKIVKK